MEKNRKRLLFALFRAEDGDPAAVRELLTYFRKQVDKEQHPDSLVLRYLADAFAKILEGEAADRALGLVQSRGRPATDHDETHFFMALHVEFLRQRQGKKLDEALKEVGQEYRKSESVVRRAWLSYRVVIDQEVLEEWEQFSSQKPTN